MISYRKVQLSDAQFLFELKNDQGVRESSILTGGGVKWEDHIAWLGAALQSPDIRFWLIVQNGQPVGTWRMDELPNGETEVAIHLMPPSRANGLGSQVLKDWCCRPGAAWLAKIVESNAASIRLFEKAGFASDGLQQHGTVRYHIYRKRIRPGPIGAIFMPWWGPAPSWVSDFLLRTMSLESLDVVLVGDAGQWVTAADVPRIPCTMDEFEARASETAGVPVHKCHPCFPRGQSLCELRPMMAEMYPEAIKGYAWWGWGDWDCVWGDWDSYLTDERLAQNDMISSCSYTVNGPFQLLRNTAAINGLYRNRLDAVQFPGPDHHLDEQGMQGIVAEEDKAGRIRSLYPQELDSSDRNESWPRCMLQGRKLYRADKSGRIGGEILNFHFPAGDRWPLVA